MYFRERLLFLGDYFPYLSRKILRGISLTEELITPEHSYSSFSVASALADTAEYMTSWKFHPSMVRIEPPSLVVSVT